MSRSTFAAQHYWLQCKTSCSFLWELRLNHDSWRHESRAWVSIGSTWVILKTTGTWFSRQTPWDFRVGCGRFSRHFRDLQVILLSCQVWSSGLRNWPGSLQLFQPEETWCSGDWSCFLVSDGVLPLSLSCVSTSVINVCLILLISLSASELYLIVKWWFSPPRKLLNQYRPWRDMGALPVMIESQVCILIWLSYFYHEVHFFLNCLTFRTLLYLYCMLCCFPKGKVSFSFM